MKTIMGIMGGSAASPSVSEQARQTGRLVAEQGWVLLTGGRDAGVMAAASRGASEAGGLVVGILPGAGLEGVAPHVDIAIPTGMGDARNVINVLASHAVIAFPGGAGTVSEVALALKNGKTVINVGVGLGSALSAYYESGQLLDADSPSEVIAALKRTLPGERP